MNDTEDDLPDSAWLLRGITALDLHEPGSVRAGEPKSGVFITSELSVNEFSKRGLANLLARTDPPFAQVAIFPLSCCTTAGFSVRRERLPENPDHCVVAVAKKASRGKRIRNSSIIIACEGTVDALFARIQQAITERTEPRSRGPS